MRLRDVSHDDCQLLWQWVNDSATRKASFSSNPIDWNEHVKWFIDKITDLNCHIYILLDNKNQPIGQVRFDISNDEAEISISIAPDHRNKGYGTKGIEMASKQLLQDRAINKIYAYIKQENKVSIKCFTNAGYKLVGTTKMTETEAIQLILTRSKVPYRCDHVRH